MKHRLLAVLVVLLVPLGVSAQELEPGAYWPVPRGLNIVTVANSFNWGDMSFEPSAPIDEANAKINTTAFAYTRSFNLAGRSANIGIVVPLVTGHLEGLLLGEPAEGDRFGFGDPRVRLAMNVYGAPTMTPKEFAAFQHRTLIGLSVTVSPPLGEYDASKLINIGTHRWSFKPEVGISRALGHWVIEGMLGAWLFTDNDDFFNGGTREQAPILGTQLHLTYKFSRTMWFGGNANFYTGGRTTLNGNENLDLQRNSRVGATFSSALGRRQAIRISVSRGAFTTIGAAFTSLGASYNYAWAR
jgi:Putative MetA-pathway of phenol degradation